MAKQITIETVKFIAYSLAKKTMDWDQPIPAFETRFPNILESCLIIPFQKFNKRQLYKGLAGKAGILFYLLIKNHPFQNGNKRLAVTSLLVFLYLNNKWLKTDKTSLYNFAVWVAQSPAELKDETVKAIEKFIINNIAKLD